MKIFLDNRLNSHVIDKKDKDPTISDKPFSINLETFNELPSDEEFDRQALHVLAGNLLFTSNEKKTATLRFLEAEDIKPISMAERISGQRYINCNGNYYSVNETELDIIYKIIVDTSTTELIAKFLEKKPQTLKNLRKMIKNLVPKIANQKVSALPNILIESIILRAFSNIYNDYVKRDVDSTQNIIILSDNAVIFNKQSICANIGNMIVRRFIDVNCLHNQNKRRQITETNSYKGVIVYQRINDEELLQLINYIEKCITDEVPLEAIIHCFLHYALGNKDDLNIIISSLKIYAIKYHILSLDWMFKEIELKNLFKTNQRLITQLGLEIVQLLLTDPTFTEIKDYTCGKDRVNIPAIKINAQIIDDFYL